MRFVVDAFSTLSSKPVNVKGLACARYICWWLSCEMPYILPLVVFLAHFLFKWVASTQIHCELEIRVFTHQQNNVATAPFPLWQLFSSLSSGACSWFWVGPVVCRDSGTPPRLLLLFALLLFCPCYRTIHGLVTGVLSRTLVKTTTTSNQMRFTHLYNCLVRDMVEMTSEE